MITKIEMENRVIVAVIKGSVQLALKGGDEKLALQLLRRIADFHGRLTEDEIKSIQPASASMIETYQAAVKSGIDETSAKADDW